MTSLADDLQTPKKNLDQFFQLASRVIAYLPNVITAKEITGKYAIYSSTIAGSEKFVRPINQNLLVNNEIELAGFYKKLKKIFSDKRKDKHLNNSENADIIDKTLYTIQQMIGAGLDLLVEPNSARKHVGNRFEELMKCVFDEMGVANKHIVLKIPYETEEGAKMYKCENDLILSLYPEVKSTSKTLNEKEVVVSAKTTSKDRMGKMFIDKILLERFVGHDQKVIGIFLNDVQRKQRNNISHTLVSGLFMVYTKFLTKLDGIYYLDPPPNALKEPYNQHMNRFSKLVMEDIDKLLTT